MKETFLVVVGVILSLALTISTNESHLPSANFEPSGGHAHLLEIAKLALIQKVKPEDAKALYEAFDLVIASLQAVIDEEKITYTKEIGDLRAYKKAIESSYRSVKEQLSEAESKLTLTYEPLQKDLRQQISSAKSDILKNQNAIKDLSDAHGKEVRSYNERIRDLTELIAVIDRAIQLLSAVKGGTAAPSLSLVEMQEKTNLIHSIRQGIEKVETESMKTLVNMLLLKMEGDFDAKDSARKIINLLLSLRRRLDGQRIKANQELKTSEDSYTKTNTNLWNLDAQLNDNRVKLQDDLYRVQGQIKVVERQISSLKDIVAKWKESLDSTMKVYNEKKDLHTKQAKSFDYELKLVSQAMQELASNGLPRPA